MLRKSFLLMSGFWFSLSFPGGALTGTDSGNAEEGPRQKPVKYLLVDQEPARISPRVLEKVTPENALLIVSLGEQRAWLQAGDEVAIDTPISSGKRVRMTPTGDFKILEKRSESRTERFGHFVDELGRSVRVGVSRAIDSAPAGTRFEELEAKFFMRVTTDGIGLHAGPLPGYPAGNGSVRFPGEVAARIYEKVAIGTRVKIVE